MTGVSKRANPRRTSTANNGWMNSTVQGPFGALLFALRSVCWMYRSTHKSNIKSGSKQEHGWRFDKGKSGRMLKQ